MAATDRRDVRAGVLRPDAAAQRPYQQRGVALIITLILLAVVTVMAVAFLATSRRERGAVTTTTDTVGARLAADAALAQAESQIMANVLATTNPYNFGLVVSTNYLPPTTGNSLDDLTNMLISPRAPVWLSNSVTGFMENRFYLDLNRNGEDDPNGVMLETNNLGLPTGNTVTEVGDPEWIGVLDHPDQPHGPNNRFIARYAFIAVPIGNALDLNAIHNQVLNNYNPLTGNLTGNDGFFRNEGVGSWEINLAGFLADLNMNEWGQSIGGATWYQYNEPTTQNSGDAFDDARALLAYRYNDNYNSLYSLQKLYGANGYSAYFNGDIDTYTLGNPMINTYLPGVHVYPKQTPWAGADNTNHFFDMQELFNPNESSVNFTNRLLSAANSTSTYDRYTFYRLLSQLGTDSTPEQNKMNLNYDNLDPFFNGVLDKTNGVASATNFVPWTALGFFTNAADRMLRAYSQEWIDENPSNYLATYFATNGFGMTTIPQISITDIPVYVNGTNVYSSAINRVLQLAANMYDATTSRYYDNSLTPLPTVFRPIFSKGTNSNVYISDFDEVTNINQADEPLSVPYNLENNVFGVPFIIGAKKGFPNFNEFYMENVFQLTRKLQVTRSDTNATVTTNPSAFNYYEMFNLSLSSHLGLELWNSYTNNYTRSTDIYVNDYMTTALTNDEKLFSYTNNLIASMPITNVTVWPGYNLNFPANSFLIPLATNFPAVPVGTYRFNGGNPYVDTNINLAYETKTPFGPYPQPHWGMTMTNNLQVIMVDHTTGRLIDYVQLNGPNSVRDLTAEILTNYDTVGTGTNTGYNDLWDTNYSGGVPIGISEQLRVSQGLGKPIWSLSLWGAEPTAYNQMNGLNIFLNGKNGFPLTYPGYPGFNTAQMGIVVTNYVGQVSYTPTATVVQHITWQANDPLVHYISSDLQGGSGNNFDTNIDWPAHLGLQVNTRYWPWGGNPNFKSTPGQSSYPVVGPNNLAVEDPLVWRSDDWDFPTYKLPTIGWLGRVHRGTPWQTVYLKASDILKTSGIGTWINWTGNVNPFNATNTFDANNTAPVRDRLLFDLFTTAPNDNATRGQLSVNVGANDTNNLQTGLAAWSALFSGVMVLSNNAIAPVFNAQSGIGEQHANSLTNYTAFPINPAGSGGINSPLGQLVANINQTRTNLNLFPLQAFTHAGDILSVPQLTEQSPFLNFSSLPQFNNGISDEMYEWLPQQTMSLLRVSGTPQSPMRYVIYCYGQTLKPAPTGIVTTSGSLFGTFGICTNYQVVAEAATRAVVQFGSTVTNVPALTNINGTLYWPNAPVPPSVISNNAVIEGFNVLPPD